MLQLESCRILLDLGSTAVLDLDLDLDLTSIWIRSTAVRYTRTRLARSTAVHAVLASSFEATAVDLAVRAVLLSPASQPASQPASPGIASSGRARHYGGAAA